MSQQQEAYYVADRWGSDNNSRSLHTDEDCHHLNFASSVREADKDEIEKLDVCLSCQGKHNRNGSESSHHSSLIEAAKENQDDKVIVPDDYERFINWQTYSLEEVATFYDSDYYHATVEFERDGETILVPFCRPKEHGSKDIENRNDVSGKLCNNCQKRIVAKMQRGEID